ncbi:MAG TPA: asparagine synthase (glutamine-hydrolyzing) [Gemmatimonadales bacterium]
MCGIAGRFHPVALPQAPGWPARADALLLHRGPDGGGQYGDERCELVHRRLALIDLSPTGHQPMANEDESVLVIFNGEIYNHQELRAQLTAAGHRFRGTSDTEVLVHLYEDRGERLVEDLRGIFAFAIYDRPRRRLTLARDRFGVKPLFYAQLDGQWVFASEIKAIAALPGFRPTLDRQACYDFLGLGYVPEPTTGFGNIAALPSASTLTIAPEGHALRRYHEVIAEPNGHRDLGAVSRMAEERLLAAVKRQAVADVPVAALLSGGIDSSLVVAAHRRATGEATTTFNVRFPDRRYDETETALAVSRQYATRHHTIDLGDWAMTTDSLLDLFRHFDQPFADTSLVPMYWIARAVRERGIICALSGDGGDEVFGGYARFWQVASLARLMRCPPWLLAPLAVAGSRATRWSHDWGRRVVKAIQLARAGRVNSAIVLAGFSNYLTEDQKEILVPPDARAGLAPVYRHFDGHVPPGTADLETLSQRITESCFAVSLPGDMLRKVDMMSMRASIEVRVPLLDEDVVGLGVSLPHRLKATGHTGKRVLRALAHRWLPREVAVHPKQGFSVPLDIMVPPGFHDALAALLLGDDARTRALFHDALMRRWLADFRSGASRAGGEISRGGLYQRVFTALALELWLREYRLTW